MKLALPLALVLLLANCTADDSNSQLAVATAGDFRLVGSDSVSLAPIVQAAPPLAAIRWEERVVLAFADEVATFDSNGNVEELIPIEPTAVAAEIAHSDRFTAFTLARPAIGTEPASTRLFTFGDDGLQLLLSLDGEVALVGVYEDVVLVRETSNDGNISAIGLDGSVARVGISGRDAILIPRTSFLIHVPTSRAPFDLLDLDGGNPVAVPGLPAGAFGNQAVASPSEATLAIDLVDAETREPLGLWILQVDLESDTPLAARRLEAPSGILAGYTTDGSAIVVLTADGATAVSLDGSQSQSISVEGEQTPFEWSRASLVLSDVRQS